MVTVSRIAILAIVIGAIARFAFLDAPLFFRDEAITGLFATGHPYATYSRLFDGKQHAAAEIVATSSVEPALGPIAVVRVLAAEDPHHAPLFYVLERLWIGIFGTSVSAFRSLPALLGLAAVGLAFALVRMLASVRTACIAASLFALSPMFVSLSRDAREYGLLIDAVLLATIACIAGLRRGSFVSWSLYAVAVAVGLYADSLFAVVLPAHLLIALRCARDARVRSVVAWAASCAVGVASFAPWALNAFHAGSRIAHELDWVRTPYSLRYAAIKWVFNLGSLAFDGEFASLRYGVLGALAALMVVVAVGSIAMRASRPLHLVALAMSATTIVAFLALDSLQHAHFATVARYMCVAWIGLELALAGALGDAFDDPKYARLAATAWGALLVLGVASFGIRGPTEGWWNNTDDIAYRSVARVIEGHEPIVVTIEDREQIALELARYLSPNDRLLLLQPSRVPACVPDPAMLVAPTAELLATVRRSTAHVVNIAPNERLAYEAEREKASDPAGRVDAANALWYVTSGDGTGTATAPGCLGEVRHPRT